MKKTRQKKNPYCIAQKNHESKENISFRKEEFVEMEEGSLVGPGYSVAISNSLFKETSE